MGVRGPIPERSDQIVRRNKPDTPIEKITTIGPVGIPDLNMPNAHPLVIDLYESMKVSAQKQFFEPSDWQVARLAMHVIHDMLQGKGEDKRISPMMLASVNSMLSTLLVTEGDRRRVRIEVERNQAEGVVIDVAEMFRAQLEKRG